MSIQFPFLAIKGESKIFFFPLSSYTTKCPGIRFRGTGMIGGGVRPKGVDPINTTYPTFSRSIKFMDFYPFADIETITSRLRLFIQLYTFEQAGIILKSWYNKVYSCDYKYTSLYSFIMD